MSTRTCPVRAPRQPSGVKPQDVPNQLRLEVTSGRGDEVWLCPGAVGAPGRLRVLRALLPGLAALLLFLEPGCSRTPAVQESKESAGAPAKTTVTGDTSSPAGAQPHPQGQKTLAEVQAALQPPGAKAPPPPAAGVATGSTQPPAPAIENGEKLLAEAGAALLKLGEALARGDAAQARAALATEAEIRSVLKPGYEPIVTRSLLDANAAALETLLRQFPPANPAPTATIGSPGTLTRAPAGAPYKEGALLVSNARLRIGASPGVEAPVDQLVRIDQAWKVLRLAPGN